MFRSRDSVTWDVAYSGMGFARDSEWLSLRDEDFMEKFTVLYEAHVDFGSTGCASFLFSNLMSSLTSRRKGILKGNEEGKGQGYAVKIEMCSKKQCNYDWIRWRQKLKEKMSQNSQGNSDKKARSLSLQSEPGDSVMKTTNFKACCPLVTYLFDKEGVIRKQQVLNKE